MTLSTTFSELMILWQPNLVWWYTIISQCLVKNLITASEVKVTAKVQNVNECLSGRYLLNRWTFYYQTCYVDALPWTRASSKKSGLLYSRSRPHWTSYDQNMTCNVYSELVILLQLNCFDGTSSWAGLSCEKIGLLCCGQGQAHRKG